MMPAFAPTSHYRPLTATLAAAVILCAACNDAPEEASESTPAGLTDTATLSAAAVDIANFSYDSVQQKPWRTTITVPARVILDPSSVEMVSSITEGRIRTVTVRVGDRVSAGQVLVMIHSHEMMDARGAMARAQSQLIAADNELRLARAGAERAGRLLEAKAIARAEAERMQAAASTAEAERQQAAAEVQRVEALIEHLGGRGPMPPGADLHDVLIRTPVSGIVTARSAQAGQVVLPGAPLVTVGNPTALLLQMHVPERAAGDLRPGASVRYTVASNTGDTLLAAVTRIAPTVDTVSRTVEVLATPTISGRRPLAESFAQAQIESATGGLDVLVVPAAAVQEFEGDQVVFTVEQRGDSALIRAVPVQGGRRSGAFQEIVSGVTAGQRVIVRGASIAKAELLKRRGVGGEE
jgi:cobalt-zinc-cadmium efflux system membrane fusion protein